MVLLPQETTLHMSMRTYNCAVSYSKANTTVLCGETAVLRQARSSVWAPQVDTIKSWWSYCTSHHRRTGREYSHSKLNTSRIKNCLRWRYLQEVTWFPPALAQIIPCTPRYHALLVAAAGIDEIKRAVVKLGGVERRYLPLNENSWKNWALNKDPWDHRLGGLFTISLIPWHWVIFVHFTGVKDQRANVTLLSEILLFYKALVFSILTMPARVVQISRPRYWSVSS